MEAVDVLFPRTGGRASSRSVLLVGALVVALVLAIAAFGARSYLELRDTERLLESVDELDDTARLDALAAVLEDRATSRGVLAGAAAALSVAAAGLALLFRRAVRSDFAHAASVLADSERRYRAVVDGVRDVIFTTDVEGRWTFLSPSWIDLTGFGLDETLGTPFLESVYPPDRGGCIEEFAGLLAGTTAELRKNVRYLTVDGTPIHVDVWVRLNDEGTGTIGTLADRSEQRAFEQRLQDLALQDPLTGLANRVLLNQHLDAAIARCGRSGANLAVLFMDLDRFKLINDSLGHDVGDDLLVAVSARIRESLRPYDSAARLGGDEFVVVCSDLESDPAVALAQARQVSQRLEDAIRVPFTLDGREVVVTASVGITLAETDATADSLLAQADQAMYRAKDMGKGRHEVFDDHLRKEADWYFETEHALRRAIERNEFRLHYQPVVDAATQRTVGCEALLRWQRPGHGLLSPGDFLGVAEDVGLMRDIGAWVVDQAVADASTWHGLVPETAEFSTAINLSARQLASTDLADQLRTRLDEYGLPGARLIVEITENHVLDADSRTLETLHEIHGLGVKLAMDDFGTGYSSLAFIRRLPLATLKIDRSFVENLGVEEEDTRIVELVLSLGRSLGLTTIGEGVERPSQLRMLRALGCDQLQGYLIARPMPAAELTARLVAERAGALAAG